MSYSTHGLLLFALFFINKAVLQAQSIPRPPSKLFVMETLDTLYFGGFSENKKIPDAIRLQVLTALSFYPELAKTRIIFRMRKRKTPLASRPQLWSVFKKRKNRTYIITISTASNDQLSPILLNQLPFNAQIGVLGHELGHSAYYDTKSTFQLLGLSFKLLRSKNTDAFEFNTDRICIDHGLGYQLYDWSKYVREVFQIKAWRGASEGAVKLDTTSVDQRYMNPPTIKKYMDQNPIYANMH
ncbi:hypothetical protein [Spongiimicrobium sp. 3-5]|uniref:hypothetical protein n=1 Tax=Spongiimicrobium sp. 3-5 TaxID=3332596 RepID=UPI003980F369